MSTIKRCISLLLVLCTVAGYFHASASAVSNHNRHSEVLSTVFVSSVADPCNGMFTSDTALTRGMFFYALWKHCNSPKPDHTEKQFADVDVSDYYYDAVYWAVESNITGSVTATEFGPDVLVSRANAATFLYRALSGGDPAEYSECPFTDVDEYSFFYEPVCWVSEKRLMTALDEEGFFKPSETCYYGDIYWDGTAPSVSNERPDDDYEEEIHYPPYPDKERPYWIIFREGFRDGRVELSVFDITSPTDDLYIVWDQNLTLSDHSKFGGCNQYYISDMDEWTLFVTGYNVMSDYATDIIASNLDVYSGSGELVCAKSAWPGDSTIWFPNDLNSTPNNGTYTSPQESAWYDIWRAGTSKSNTARNSNLNVGDQIYPTGDSWRARADIPFELSHQVSISKDGWITCQIPQELVYTCREIVLYPDTKKEPFAQFIVARKNGDSIYVNLSCSHLSVYENAMRTYDMFVDINWNGHSPGKIYLKQGNLTLDLKEGKNQGLLLGMFSASGDDLKLCWETADGIVYSQKTYLFV